MEINFEDDLAKVQIAINALPRNIGKRDYVQKLFDSLFPNIYKQVTNKQKTKREIADNLKDTPMQMSYSSFLSKYDEAEKAMKAKKRKNPKEFAKASRDFK